VTSPQRRRMKYLVGINERSLDESEDDAREFLYVDISTVGHGALTANPARTTFGEAPSRARRLVRAGDTIVSTVRTYLRAVWPVRGDASDVVVSTGFAVLTPRDELDERFLGWWSQSNAFIDEIVSRSTGVSYPAINPSEIGEIRMPVPPLMVQRAIADYLDVETARIDALIAKKRRMVELLAARSQAVIDQQMEVSYKTQDTAPISSVCEAIVDCVNKTAPLAGHETAYKMIRTTNVRDGRVDLLEVDCVEHSVFARWNRRGQPRRGDLLLTREAPMGEAGLVDTDEQVFLGQRLVMYRCDPSRALPEFLLLALRSTRVRDQISLLGEGALHAHLRVGECSKLLVPRVPLDGQREILRRLGQQLANHAALGRALDSQIRLLVEHRRALITAAVTGELVVPGVAA
jgi:type I restriction enzyme S subunit